MILLPSLTIKLNKIELKFEATKDRLNKKDKLNYLIDPVPSNRNLVYELLKIEY